MKNRSVNNLADQGNVYITFSGKNLEDSLSFLKYFVIGFQTPSVSYENIEEKWGGENLKIQSGEKQFGDLSVDFLVDEKLYVYEDLLRLGDLLHCTEDSEVIIDLFMIDDFKKPVAKLEFSSIIINNIEPLTYTFQDGIPQIELNVDFGVADMIFKRIGDDND